MAGTLQPPVPVPPFLFAGRSRGREPERGGLVEAVSPRGRIGLAPSRPRRGGNNSLSRCGHEVWHGGGAAENSPRAAFPSRWRCAVAVKVAVDRAGVLQGLLKQDVNLILVDFSTLFS